MKSQQHQARLRGYPLAGRLGCTLATLLAWTIQADPGQDGPGTPAPEADGNDLPRLGYDLFHPTPREFLRELSADRPDKTESAYSVDAGHFQVEMDFANFVYDKENGTTTRAWNVAPLNLKLGLCDWADFQLVWEGFLQVDEEEHATHRTKVRSGVGDFSTRIKINLWGNDGGRTAFSVMPFLKFPTSTGDVGSNAVEGGLIFPLAVELGSGWSMGMMTEVDFLHDHEASGRFTSFVNSIAVGHDIAGNLAGYVEFFSEVSTQHGERWAGTLGLGLTYAFTRNLQLDAGINLGVTRAAEDLNPFTGLTWRY